MNTMFLQSRRTAIASRRAAVRLAVAVTIVLAGLVSPGAVASAVDGIRMTLVSQSSITAPGGTASFVVSIDRTPDNLVVSAAVYPRLNDAVTAMDDALRGSFVGDPFRPVLEQRLDALLDDEVGVYRIDLPTSVNDEPDRLRLRDDGVYPVRITLRERGDVIAQMVTFITRADPEAAQPLIVALTADMGNAVLRQPDGRVDADNIEQLGLLADFPTTTGLPLTLAVQPENIATLTSSGTPEFVTLASRLADVARSGQVVADTYIDLDPSTVLTDEWLSEYTRQRSLAQRTLTQWLGRPYVDDGVRWLRRPQSDAAIELMRSNGMTALVGSPSLVDLPKSIVPLAPHTLQSGVGGSFTTLVLPVDELGTSFGIDTIGDRTLSATRFRSRLDHLALGARTRRGVAIQLAGTGLTLETVKAFTDAVAEHPLVRFTTVRGLINDVNPALAGALLEFRKFTAKPPNPGAGAAAAVSLVRLDLDQLGSMTSTAPANPEEILTIAASSVLTDESRTAYLNAAKAPFEVLRDAISAPGGERITLNGGRGSFPLTVRSKLVDRDLKVRLRLSSARATFPDNDFMITLVNGVWQDNLSVEAREGRYEILVEVFAPQGDRLLTSGSIDVQTLGNLGGIGLVLSVGALVLLITWWVASSRRRRRQPVDIDDLDQTPASERSAELSGLAPWTD